MSHETGQSGTEGTVEANDAASVTFIIQQKRQEIQGTENLALWLSATHKGVPS